jgi:hypothetical protein
MFPSCWLLATSSAAAKHKSYHKSSVAEKKHQSAGAKQKHKSLASKKDKPFVAAKEEPIAVPEPRTPGNTQDCIAQAQALYKRAETTAKRAKQSIPREFERVISKLDELCGEEEFDKARISLDWMHTCLQNFSKDSRGQYCSRTASYFCAIDGQSDACVISPAQP